MEVTEGLGRDEQFAVDEAALHSEVDRLVLSLVVQEIQKVLLHAARGRLSHLGVKLDRTEVNGVVPAAGGLGRELGVADHGIAGAWCAVPKVFRVSFLTLAPCLDGLFEQRPQCRVSPPALYGLPVESSRL